MKWGEGSEGNDEKKGRMRIEIQGKGEKEKEDKMIDGVQRMVSTWEGGQRE